jgi:hypothetical protein
MELVLTRKFPTKNSCIGELTENGVHRCWILEDVDRGLDYNMPLEEIKALKVYGQTAIPTGRYEIVITFSNRFKKPLPLLLNVPGYAGVRVHSGNRASDSDGCLLTGTEYGVDEVLNSRAAFVPLASAIELAIQQEKVFITIQRG